MYLSPMKTISDLLDIIAALRDPHTGCPWDKEQTHESLRPYVIEEAYEVAAAIEDEPESLTDELGDLLLQVVLHAQIAKEDQRFTFEDIVNVLSQKLIRRHPHVFGDEKAETAEDVKVHWERIKKEEKSEEGLLSSMTKGLPALLESYKIGKKVARVNFDWDTIQEIREKVAEELSEVDEVLEVEGKRQELEEEIGDLLFTVAQLARKADIEPEEALKRANRKFTERFSQMEEISDKPLGDIPRETLEKLWQQVKETLNKS